MAVALQTNSERIFFQKSPPRTRRLEISITSPMRLPINPDNLDFLYAQADFYLKRTRWADAKKIAEQMVAKHPPFDLSGKILDFIRKRS